MIRIRSQRAVTLVEMLVAIGITIGMLAASSLIFQAASQASGKANANNEIMAQARALTNQLQKDFQGLRSDLPMAVIFESALDPITGEPIRCDRIVFFANGDYQIAGRPAVGAYDGSISGNLARITYAQSDLGDPKRVNVDDGNARYILTRQQKLITVDTTTTFGTPPPDGIAWELPYPRQYYRNAVIEVTTAEWWKNEAQNYVTNFEDYYFNEDAHACWFARPNITDMVNFVDPWGQPYYPEDAIQRQYLLRDVSEFKIELFLGMDWFPYYSYYPDAGASTDSPYAFYWNVADLDNTTDDSVRIPNSSDGIYWHCIDDQIPRFGTVGDPFTLISAVWPNFWPQAIRITFTLHDRNRKYYPDGITFEYVIPVNPK